MTRADKLRLGIIIAAVGTLEALCRGGVIGSFTMIPPSAMASAALHQLAIPATLADFAFTFANAVAAAAIAILGGFALGAALHAAPRWRRVVAPLLACWYAVPTFVFYPLLIVLLGLNRAPLIALGALSGIVAMVVNTLDGLDRLPPAILKAGRALRMDSLRIALLIRLPAAAPHLFTGAKLATAYAIIGVVAAEFILATAGIGRRIVLAFNDLDNTTMYGLLLALLLAIALLNSLIRRLEHHLNARWGLG